MHIHPSELMLKWINSPFHFVLLILCLVSLVSFHNVSNMKSVLLIPFMCRWYKFQLVLFIIILISTLLCFQWFWFYIPDCEWIVFSLPFASLLLIWLSDSDRFNSSGNWTCFLRELLGCSCDLMWMLEPDKQRRIKWM